jgi:hypothetical protein
MLSAESPDPDFARVQELIDGYGGSGAAAVTRARLNGMTAEDLLHVMARAVRRGAGDAGEFDPWSVAPGLLDARVFDQDLWWVDVTGTPRTVRQLSDEHLDNVVQFLVDGATVFRLANRPGRLDRVNDRQTDLEWLNNTPLMRGLRAEVSRRGGTQRVHPRVVDKHLNNRGHRWC